METVETTKTSTNHPPWSSLPLRPRPAHHPARGKRAQFLFIPTHTNTHRERETHARRNGYGLGHAVDALSTGICRALIPRGRGGGVGKTFMYCERYAVCVLRCAVCLDGCG